MLIRGDTRAHRSLRNGCLRIGFGMCTFLSAFPGWSLCDADVLFPVSRSQSHVVAGMSSAGSSGVPADAGGRRRRVLLCAELASGGPSSTPHSASSLPVRRSSPAGRGRRSRSASAPSVWSSSRFVPSFLIRAVGSRRSAGGGDCSSKLVVGISFSAPGCRSCFAAGLLE